MMLTGALKLRGQKEILGKAKDKRGLRYVRTSWLLQFKTFSEDGWGEGGLCLEASDVELEEGVGLWEGAHKPYGHDQKGVDYAVRGEPGQVRVFFAPIRSVDVA